MASPRPTPVRVVGPTPLSVKLEKDPEPGLHPRAGVLTVWALLVLSSIAFIWVLFVIGPSILPQTEPYISGSVETRMVYPPQSFVGDDTPVSITLINRASTPISGTLSLELPPLPPAYLKQDGASQLTFTALANGAQASKTMTFVALQGGELVLTPTLLIEGQAPQKLNAQSISISSVPRLSSWQGLAYAAFAALFGAISRPWLKRTLKRWLPTE